LDAVYKALDSVVGANFERKDLSALISLQDGPKRPLLQGLLGQGQPAKGKTHFWDEQGLITPTGSTAYYPEGGKPTADAQSPVQLNNVTFRAGKVAAVTDTERAIWTGAGSYTLADGELERLYQDAIDFQVKLKTTEVLNEMEYIFLLGNRNNNSASVSQCDGLLTWLQNNAPAGNQIAENGNLTSIMLSNAGEIQAANKTPFLPDTILCTFQQKQVINGFMAGTQRVTIAGGTGEQGLVAGTEVEWFDTGFSRCKLVVHPWLTTGNLLMINSGLFKRSDLIPMGAEPLARIATSIERMVTYEGTMEARVAKAHMLLTGLNQ
jgi:hypothetical protein